MEKPMQLTMVKAVPLFEGRACNATKLENIGESAITKNPQTHIKLSKTKGLVCCNIHGNNKQHIPDRNSENLAIV